MSALLALFTAHEYDYRIGMPLYPKHPKRDRRPAIRQTWLNDVDIPYEWFFGRPPDDRIEGLEEVFLDCPDGYFDLARKAQAIARWALEHGYDRVIKVDDDTYVYWDRFKQRPLFSEVEYSGGCWPESSFAYGAAYCWAGRLLEAVSDTPIPAGRWVSDDTWIASLAKQLSIPFVRDETIHIGRVNPRTDEQFVEEGLLAGNHDYSVLSPLTPPQMVRCHEITSKYK